MGKEELKYSFIFFIILIFLIVILSYTQNQVLTGQVIFEPEMPTDCSNESITTLWNSIFNEKIVFGPDDTAGKGISLTDITILTGQEVEGTCDSFVAYFVDEIIEPFQEKNELYFLSGWDNLGIEFSPKIQTIAIQGDFTNEYIDNLESKTLNNFMYEDLTIDTLFWKTKQRDLTLGKNKLDIDAAFKSVFTTAPNTIDDWEVLWKGIFKGYFSSFSDQEEITAGNKEIKGEISSKRDLNILIYSEDSCTPDWGDPLYTECVDDEKEEYYEDANNCGHTIGYPGNQTIYEDCDENDVLGLPKHIETKYIDDLEIKIDGEAFEDFEGSDDKEEIEIFEDSEKIIEFEWDFDDEVLDLTEVYIEKQDDDEDFGYLIVNGIDEEKTFWINRIDNLLDGVCVDDNNVKDVSSNCRGNDEYYVECPGENAGFECSLVSDRLMVSGLENSAVVQINQPVGVCTPIWTCTDWGACINENKTRTCTDSKCGEPLKTEQKSCEETIELCVPNWDCTNWEPEKCPEEEYKTRTCTDSKNCQTTSNKPSEQKSCSYAVDEINWTYGIIILAIVIVIALILGLLIHFLRKKKTPPAPAHTIQNKPRSPPQHPMAHSRTFPQRHY